MGLLLLLLLDYYYYYCYYYCYYQAVLCMFSCRSVCVVSHSNLLTCFSVLYLACAGCWGLSGVQLKTAELCFGTANPRSTSPP